MRKTSANKKKSRNASKQDLQVSLVSKVNRQLDNLNAGATIFTRRLTTSTTIASNGAGAIALFTLCSSAAVNTATDFASMANLFVGYRVKAMRARVFPVLPFIVAGIAPPPALVAISMFSSGLSVGTYPNMLDSAACKFLTGFRPAEFCVDWTNIPEAKLWTPNNVAITSSEVYGLVGIGATGNPAAQLTTVYFQVVVEYECEFITAA
jgi:hypothetical protein